jgi:hypothetical protein
MTKNFDNLLKNCLNEMQSTTAGGAQPNLVEVIKAALNSTKINSNDKFAAELKALVDKHAPAQPQQNTATKPGQSNPPAQQQNQQNTAAKPGQPNPPNQQQNQPNK